MSIDLSRFDLVAENDTVVVPVDKLVDVATYLRGQGFEYFVYCCAVHYPASESEPDRALVEYRLRRLPAEDMVLRLWIPSSDACPSLAGLWEAADWQEREQFDLVGVRFAGHPDLRRIMLPEDWPGHPLRRDYAIDTRHFPWR
ncbi:MAG: NADH-quinone oxidoreductase subunit C [Deltaproteobacteria bacterium]|nr:NADH-quinone oxidoreductase subunit C [Deltaproteobacteria bacterium]